MRHVVFLQGMPCGFSHRVGARLAAAGWRVTGIVLCAGDLLFWRRGGFPTVHYRGRYAGWPAFVETFLEWNGVTDIVLLGEQRRYHKEAVAIAQRRGIRVTVTDFGYLRPDWITLERDGMGGDSHFPKDPAAIAALAAASPPLDRTVRYRDSTAAMSVADVAYLLANVGLGWLYPFYRRTDNRPHPFVYLAASTWRDLARKAARRRNAEMLARFLASGRSYFLFPLQIEHDFQIVAYSPFRDLAEPIRRVIRSFAAHAAPDAALLVKPHPWDPGFRNWRRLIGAWAIEAGIGERVIYIEGGDLGAMTERSLGMVTVNSTSGFQALQRGRPLVALGQAIYDLPGLTFQDGLDRFWREAAPPDPALVEDFFRAMAGTIQIRGVFFSEPGLTAAVEAAAERIANGSVGLPDG